MTFDGRTATTAVMLALFVGASILALGLPQKAAFMPLLVGIPGAILCAWQLAIDLLRREPPEPPVEDRTANPAPETGGQTEVQAFVWLALFFGVLLCFGFVIGGPVIVAAFVRFSSGDRWRNALFAGVGTFVVLWGVFVWLLELSLFPGLVSDAIF